MEQLDFEYYNRHYKNLFGPNTQERYILKKANIAHIHAISKALQHTIYEVMQIAGQLKNKRAVRNGSPSWRNIELSA